MKLSLLVVNPVYVENLGMFLRESQLSGAEKVFIQDEFKLLHDENKQRLLQWSGRVSYHNPPICIEDTIDFLKENKGNYRKIATVLSPESTSINKFNYEENDLLIFGDERNGLENKIISQCDEKIYIPQIQPSEKNRKIQCRTLISAQAIFMYEFMRQSDRLT